MNQVIQNVSDTAFMVVGFRALESERPEPLFRDPLAWTLAGEHGRKILATVPKTFVGGWSVRSARSSSTTSSKRQSSRGSTRS
jgi:O-methyltransferase involved in polyketide biosynthesis